MPQNPTWNRSELILALAVYLKHRPSIPTKSSDAIISLSRQLRAMAGATGGDIDATYRNPNGVYMKLNNLKRLDPAYTASGKAGLARGGRAENEVWKEFAANPKALARAVATIEASLPIVDGAKITSHVGRAAEITPSYWLFLCSPKHWAVDRFFETNPTEGTWGVNSLGAARFAPGQLGFIRVGADKRSRKELQGRPQLFPSIYALCMVESTPFASRGGGAEFWSEDSLPGAERPTVKLRILRSYAHNPLSLDLLKRVKPCLTKSICEPVQGRSLRIAEGDFFEILDALNEDRELIANTIAIDVRNGEDVIFNETKYLHAAPNVRQRVSRFIERGPIGDQVKKTRGHECQICKALGQDPIAFLKKNGEPYAEAHHVMPVHRLQIGSLAASNIIVLCPNHHRQVHYGDADVSIHSDKFRFGLDGREIEIDRLSLAV